MKKILFVTFDEFSSINPSLEKQLVKHFPDYKLESLVLKPKLKKNNFILIGCVLAVIKEYFIDFIKGNKSIFFWREYLYQTPFFMRSLNSIIKAQLNKEKYAFVFQTQTLFDSSSASVPNFIYTDHTNLNNLNYKYINHNLYLGSSRYHILERQIYNRATCLFVMSLNIKDSLVNQYHVNPDKVKLVYAGSNAKISEVFNDNKYSNKNILFVGKDWQRKGGPLLIEAFRIVQKTIPDATLTIIGCTPEVTVKNCFITGDISLQEVARYYNQASVFCLPTKREPFGIVFIEAMLNRLAIVTNSVGATPELVINNENGFRLNYDATEYAKTLIKLLNDPAMCKRLGDQSLEMARHKYTWDNVGDLISKNINEVLKTRSISESSLISA